MHELVNAFVKLVGGTVLDPADVTFTLVELRLLEERWCYKLPAYAVQIKGGVLFLDESVRVMSIRPEVDSPEVDPPLDVETALGLKPGDQLFRFEAPSASKASEAPWFSTPDGGDEKPKFPAPTRLVWDETQRALFSTFGVKYGEVVNLGTDEHPRWFIKCCFPPESWGPFASPDLARSRLTSAASEFGHTVA